MWRRPYGFPTIWTAAALDRIRTFCGKGLRYRSEPSGPCPQKPFPKSVTSTDIRALGPGAELRPDAEEKAVNLVLEQAELTVMDLITVKGRSSFW